MNFRHLFKMSAFGTYACFEAVNASGQWVDKYYCELFNAVPNFFSPQLKGMSNATNKIFH